MRFFRPVIALLLLAVWLPATLHCEVEAAGVTLGSSCCTETDSHGASAAGETCETDGCGIVEGGFTSSTSLSVSAPLPVFNASPIWALASIPVLAPAAPPVTGVIEALAAPPGTASCWLFVTRAAPLPGAPALA
ncbi:MAG TPA: hypothetical protein VHO24_02095 [Opitutaceae bacterium]|nr:hypothetical protein [Opitutaceae bacterium]